MVTNKLLLRLRRMTCLASKLALTCPDAYSGTWMQMEDDSGMTSGRKDSERGAIGVRTVHGTEGAIIGPPADMLYAVEPEGVAMMMPSASMVVTKLPSTKASSCTVRGFAPLQWRGGG